MHETLLLTQIFQSLIPTVQEYIFTCTVLRYWDTQSSCATNVSESECRCDTPHPILLPDPVSLSHHLTDFSVPLLVLSWVCGWGMTPETDFCSF